MKIFFTKYSKLILVMLVLMVCVAGWRFPTLGKVLGLIYLLLCVTAAIFIVVLKYRQAYMQGKMSRAVCIRHMFVEIIGVLVAIVMAGLFGRYVAQVATAQISNHLLAIVLRIFVGFLVGLGIGLIVKHVIRFLTEGPKPNIAG